MSEYLLVVVLLLCLSIINNVIMYYKCYVNNVSEDPFVPNNVGTYSINIYYNKYNYPGNGIASEIKTYIDPFINKNIGKYVVSYNKPTQMEYQQIATLGYYNSQ